MAALAIPLVSGLGAYAVLPQGFTMLGMSAFGWGWTIGSMAASYLLAPDTEGPRLTDLAAGGSSYGTSIPLAYGTTKLPGNVIWASDLIETSHTESAKGGPEYTSYTYSQHLAVLVCAGPVTGIRRIWANGKLILDVSDTNTGATGQRSGLRIYTGDETQVADSLLESYLGTGNVPGHRGYCYVVFDNMQLADYGNRTPSFEFEVVGDGAYARPMAERLTATATFNGFVDTNTHRIIWLAQDHKNISYYDLATDTVIRTITTDDSNWMYWLEPGDPRTRVFWACKANSFDIYDIASGEIIATAAHPGSVSQQTMRWHAYDESFLAVQNSSLLRYTVGPDNTWSYKVIGTVPGIAVHWQSIEVTPYGFVVLYSDYHSKLVVLNGLYSVVLEYNVTSSTGSSTWLKTSTYDPVRNRVYICTSSGSNMIVVDLNTALPTASEITLAETGNVWPLYHRQSDSVIVTSTGAWPTVHVRDTDSLATATDTFYGGAGDWPASYMDGWPVEINGIDDKVILIAQGAGIGRFMFGQRLSANQIPLSAIVSDLCERAGLEAGDYDVSDLTDMVDGYRTT